MENYEKLYKQALENAKRLYEQGTITESLAYIFPELAESEDEKIRKALIKGVECCKASGWTNFGNNVDIDVVLAWLEKQGESYTKKDIDDAYMKGICDAKHELEKQGEQKPVDKVEPFDKYEGLTDFERTLADICIGWIGEELGWKQYIKDSADVLLKIAIKKFNSIQDAPFEQKSAAWSDEDEENLQHCCMAISVDSLHTYEDKQDMEAWLKSLKDRVQPKQVCGVEDEKHILSIEQVLNCADLLNVVPEKINVLKDWLKSLKERLGGNL